MTYRYQKYLAKKARDDAQRARRVERDSEFKLMSEEKRIGVMDVKNEIRKEICAQLEIEDIDTFPLNDVYLYKKTPAPADGEEVAEGAPAPGTWVKDELFIEPEQGVDSDADGPPLEKSITDLLKDATKNLGLDAEKYPYQVPPSDRVNVLVHGPQRAGSKDKF